MRRYEIFEENYLNGIVWKKLPRVKYVLREVAISIIMNVFRQKQFKNQLGK